MKSSIATVSLSGNLAEKLDAIAAAGFEGVEIFENDFLAFNAGPAEVGRMLRDAGLTASVFQPFRDFEGLPEPQRTRALERAERKFDVMGELGAELLLVCSSVSPAALGGLNRAVDDLGELGRRAASRGLRIGYEALAWGRIVNDHRDAWEIVRRIADPAVGLVLDSFHTLARGIDPETIRAIPGDNIALVQIADAPLLDMDLLLWSRHYRNMPGQGDLPLVPFLSAVKATGYRGFVSLEVFNDEFRTASPRGVAVDGRRSLLALEDDVLRHKAHAAGTKPRTRLPDRARCEAVEFVEFAVDEESAADFGRLFGALGFHHAGYHRSKEVDWWRQGDINLVLNGEKEGFAYSSYLMHGPGVCAIGMRVEDAAAAVRRAEALLASPFSQPVRQGEMAVPAIRGVGGSLLYFVDRQIILDGLWDEFVPPTGASQASPTPKGAGLLAVDHISQSTGYDEMLSWLLFYTSIFDCRRTSALEVADPAGLVRSHAVEMANGTTRIVLNGSQAHRTLSGRFLSEFFGPGVQHVAFSTSDLLAAVRSFQSAGLPMLPIPDNYYDDLDSRFDLAPAFLAELRLSGALYDRFGDQEFLQAYSATTAGGLFFEIVERRNGYGGFGAPNAPIRLAAQARAQGSVEALL